MRGRFISFEGIEGSGKSTQVGRLLPILQQQGLAVVRTHEPGGGLGEEMRDYVLLKANLHPPSEAFFMAMDRHEHMTKTIRPALERGQWVLCDRFADSTLAYQGGGSGVEREALKVLNRLATGGLTPDLTLLFDLPVELGLERVKKRAPHRKLDRFEAESLAFHERVRAAYLELARAEPERFAVIDAARDANLVFADTRSRVEALLARPAAP